MYDFDTAVERLENGANPDEVLKKVSREDKDAVLDYLDAFGVCER